MTEGNIYYHYLPSLIQNGSVILNGNFGRILNIDSGLKPREDELEAIRRIYYQDKPSRLKSIFLLKSIDDAVLYKKHREIRDGVSYADILYKVCICDTNKKKHIGCTGILDLSYTQKPFTDKDANIAHTYWREETARLYHGDGSLEAFALEVLVESPVRVVNRVVFDGADVILC